MTGKSLRARYHLRGTRALLRSDSIFHIFSHLGRRAVFLPCFYEYEYGCELRDRRPVAYTTTYSYFAHLSNIKASNFWGVVNVL